MMVNIITIIFNAKLLEVYRSSTNLACNGAAITVWLIFRTREILKVTYIVLVV